MIDDPGQPPDQAKGRFLVLQMLRLSGVALVMFGLMVLNGKVPIPAVAGYAFILAGVADALVLPAVLARSWKSPLE
jgi:hypothetical protein